MRIFDFNSNHALYRALYSRKELLQKDDGLDSHHCYVVTKKTSNKYVTTRENMSTVKNKVIEVHYKAVTNQVFTVLGILVELGTSICKIKTFS